MIICLPSRIHQQSGIAIGPILFVIALLAVIGIAISASNNTVGSTITADRVKADLKAQANLIRSKILECNQYSFDRGELADKYPSSTGTGSLVESLDCLAFVSPDTTLPDGRTHLWTGAHAATLPPPTPGFGSWYYVNAGAVGGRCIRIQPNGASASDQSIRNGLMEASGAFSPQEIVYNPGSASQRFILWITNPSGTASADCSS